MNIEDFKRGLQDAEPASFSPIGDTVKDSIEQSDSCKPANNSTSTDCEVPEFEFLSAEGEGSEQLGHLKDMLAKSENQLIQCTGKFCCKMTS